MAAVGGGERLGFDGVAEGGAGAVGLDGVDLVGGQAGVGEGGVDDALLGGPVGCGEPVAGAVLVDCAAADDRQHLMAIRRASESRSSNTIPTPSAQPVPSAAAENGLHRPSGASPRCRLNSTNMAGVDMTETPPARARSHSPRPQRLGSELDGDQRRGARRVDGDRRPLQPEGVRDPAGRDAGQVAGRQVPSYRSGRAVGRAEHVVASGDAGEDPGSGAA